MSRTQDAAFIWALAGLEDILQVFRGFFQGKRWVGRCISYSYSPLRGHQDMFVFRGLTWEWVIFFWMSYIVGKFQLKICFDDVWSIFWKDFCWHFPMFFSCRGTRSGVLCREMNWSPMLCKDSSTRHEIWRCSCCVFDHVEWFPAPELMSEFKDITWHNHLVGWGGHRQALILIWNTTNTANVIKRKRQLFGGNQHVPAVTL